MATATRTTSPDAGARSSHPPAVAPAADEVRHAGPLLRALREEESEIAARGPGAAFGLLRACRDEATPPAALRVLVDRAGVRGRAGGGYPVAHKWAVVARRSAPTRVVVCNAHARPGDRKVPYLLAHAPWAVVEATLLAARLAGATHAYVAVPAGRPDLVAAIEAAVGAAAAAGLVGRERPDGALGVALRVVGTPDVEIAGEESALLALIADGVPRPRRRPPLPVTAGLGGAPTAVNNVETLLQARLALQVGPDAYRAHGIASAPGTMLFALDGDVALPGLYELPLGTPITDLVFEHGGGMTSGALHVVFPGGTRTPPLDAAEARRATLDFDALRALGSDLGGGAVLALDAHTDVPALATRLAAELHAASCGQCRPCHDGTRRAWTMLERLGRLDEPSIDIHDRAMPAPRRRYALRVLGQDDPTIPAGVSYTDMTTGLARLTELCTFFEHRGDCHHSRAAATVLRRLVERFRPAFEARLPAAMTGGS